MSAAFDKEERDSQPQRIGEILEELLAQYEARFLNTRIVIVETAATAV